MKLHVTPAWAIISLCLAADVTLAQDDAPKLPESYAEVLLRVDGMT